MFLLYLNSASAWHFCRSRKSQCFAFGTVLIFFIFALQTLFSPLYAKEQESAQKKNPQKEEAENQVATQSQKKQKTSSDEKSFEALMKKELEGVEEGEIKTERPSWAAQLLKTTIVLIILLGIFYTGYRIYLFKRNLPRSQATAVKVLYEYTLMPGRYLQIVEMGTQLLVLGISESGVHLVTEISDKNQIDNIKIACDRDKFQTPPDFLGELTKRTKEKFNNWRTGDSAIADEPAPTYNTWENWRQNSREKLRRMKEQREFLRNQDDPMA